MAKIFPEIEEDFNNSLGERKVFDCLKKLPDDWYVFHSVNWSKKRGYGKGVVWGEADFLLLNRDYGILVLEVKSGDVYCRDGQLYQQRLDNGETFKMAPLEQANKSKYEILGELKKRDLDRKCFIGAAVWFPSIDGGFENVDLPLNYEPELILTGRNLENPLRAVIDVYNFYGAGRFTKLDEGDEADILDVIIPEFDLVPMFGAVKDEINYKYAQLTDDQKRILDFIEDEENAAIAGAAGTGKTFVAIERTNRLSKDGKALYLCFNRFLNDFLENNSTLSNVEFYNIHKFLFEQGLLPSLDETQSIELLEDFSFRELGYKYCVIDEAQDFDSGLLERIVGIAKREGVGMTLFYDKNQLVIKDELPGIVNDFDCKMTLKKNCRNTNRIIDTMNSGLKLKPNPGYLTVEGEMPVLLYGGKDEILAKVSSLIDQLRKAEYTLEDIVILTMRTEGGSILAGVDRLGEYEISGRRESGKIFFTTARKFKGLEADCVIIVDYDMACLDEHEKQLLFYVASSRARQRLYVLMEADEEKMLGIGERIEGAFGPMMRLSNKIKMKIEGLSRG